MQLSFSNVINISVSQTPIGAGNYNTSNVALFTDEIPAMSFGSLGYAIYLEPTQVATDFGSTSKTAEMADAVFSQSPNILANDGALIVILMGVASQTLTFSAVAASGTFVFNYGGHASAAINWNDTAAQVQAKLRAMAGLSEVLVTGTIAGEVLTVKYAGVYGVLSLATITSNSVEDSGSSAITITVATSVVGETFAAAVTRTVGLVQYFALMATATVAELGQTDVLALAAVVQPLNKIALVVSFTEADIQSGGTLDLLRTGSFDRTRGLYYGDLSGNAALLYAASYAGRAFSVNFSGSNTTLTMHLKVLVGVQPDPSMTQSILDEAKAAGADTYVSLQGVPGVFSVGANRYFDQVYNREWFTGALQIAGFNYLAQTQTKIPQTENGMDGLKQAYGAVCAQGITNQYGAPGKWTSTTFGNQADLLLNVSQVGYYIFSLPIAQQLQVDRAARKAPLVQIAFKEAGAIQESDVLVNINP